MITERQRAAALAEGTLGRRLSECAENPNDPSRPALVVQGGGLRGVYSLGALAVLEDLRLKKAFSRVVGSSAGAINGAYFLAGQAREGLSIYIDDLSTRRFVNPWRFWRIVDIDFMIDALKRAHRLDERAMLDAPSTLYIVLTDARTAERRVISNRDPSIDLYEAFRATAALPGLYNRRVRLVEGGPCYVDGGVSDLIPLDLAFERIPGSEAEKAGSPSSAVVLLTRGKGHVKSDRGLLFQAVVRVFTHRQSPAVRAKICGADSAAYNAVVARLEGEGGSSPRQTWTVRPSDVRRLVNRTTNDRHRLRNCAALAEDDTVALLAEPCPDRLSSAPRLSVGLHA